LDFLSFKLDGYRILARCDFAEWQKGSV